MQENLLDNKTPIQEKFPVRFEIAKPEDWEAYKKIRLEAINGPDQGMFGPRLAARQRVMSDEMWRANLEPAKDFFIVLLRSGSKVVGMGSAVEMSEKGMWQVGSAYINPEYRGGTGKKLLAFRLREIIENRGGQKIEVGILKTNDVSKSVCKFFGFKETTLEDSWQFFELDLNENKDELLKKINEVLHER